jgi:hypothetical protein
MSILRRSLSIALLACVLVACSSDGEKPAKQEDDGGSDEPTTEEDAGADEQESEQDAGMKPSAPVPLTVWVDDLVDNHTTDESEPDTVDDKIITDDTDETSFDKYLP